LGRDRLNEQNETIIAIQRQAWPAQRLVNSAPRSQETEQRAIRKGKKHQKREAGPLTVPGSARSRGGDDEEPGPPGPFPRGTAGGRRRHRRRRHGAGQPPEAGGGGD